jgi:DNA polymerase III subunit gamma/tau
LEYLVLARKFRPQIFEDVAGQEAVVKTLRNSIGQGRVAHAFLFSGPRGVGKTSVARILAKSLNCEKGPTATPCNVCSNCREITNGSSLDVREIDGASNRGIDEIRELRENVKFAPAAAKYKIYIIDEVHMLTREAFNALLKTLEEPPAHVIFIFATTENHKVPATILSRCQCYDFRRISLQEIAANLGRVADAEGIKISPSALLWIAEAGDGSMRDAQSIFDQVISYAGMDIKDDDVEESLGLADRKYLFRISEAVLQRNAGACLIILEEAYLAGIDMKHFYQIMVKHFRNLLLVKIADGSSSFDIAPEQIEKLKNQAQAISRETLQRFVEILIAEEGSFLRSQEPRMKLETILVKMAYLEPIIPLAEIISAIENIEQRLQPGLPAAGCNSEPPYSTSNPVKETPADYSTKSSVVPDTNKENNSLYADNNAGDLKTLGSTLKKFIKKENEFLGRRIDSAEIISYENECVTLGFPKNYIFLEEMTTTTQKEKLEQIARDFFQKNVAIKIATLEAENGNANGNNGRKQTNGLNDIKREAMNQPLLQKIMDEISDAKIVEIKVQTDKN